MHPRADDVVAIVENDDAAAAERMDRRPFDVTDTLHIDWMYNCHMHLLMASLAVVAAVAAVAFAAAAVAVAAASAVGAAVVADALLE